MREFQATQDEFRSLAGRLNGGDPIAAWRKAKDAHPAPGAWSRRRSSSSRSCSTFIDRNGIVTRAGGRTGHRRADSGVLPLDVCEHVDARPFEQKPSRAFYYLTDVDPSWPADRQDEHLRDFNYPTLWAISIHEVYPGHFLHYQYLRRVESKVRKSILFSPASFVEGWAHYCEQMMVEAGFRRNDPAFKLGAARRGADPARPLHRRHPAARARTGRSSRASASSATKRFWRKPARAAKPSAARSIRPILSIRSGS